MADGVKLGQTAAFQIGMGNPVPLSIRRMSNT